MARQSRRDRWKGSVQKDRNLSAEARLFLVACLAPKMNAQGFVSVPRKRLANHAGVSERQVTNYVKAAKDAGWLLVVQAGYRTMTAVYQASFPNTKAGSLEFPLSETESGKRKDPHCAGSLDFPLSAEESGKSWFPSTSSSTTRTRRGHRRTVRQCTQRVRNDDALEGVAGSDISARRSAPSLDALTRGEISSSSKASRHLQVVPA